MLIMDAADNVLPRAALITGLVLWSLLDSSAIFLVVQAKALIFAPAAVALTI